jgi:hypothetical protein
MPCRGTKGLECVFPIWFKQCCCVWFTLAMLWPCRSIQGHGTERLSKDGLWATCPRSASSGYHAEFHEVYQKHTTPPHNDPYLRLERVVVANYKKRLAVRVFPATMRTFTKDTALSEQGMDAAWHVRINQGMAGEWHAMCESALTLSLEHLSLPLYWHLLTKWL